MKLRITDYSEQPELCDALRRYYTLLQMTFDTNIFKIFETPTSQIVRFVPIQSVATPSLVQKAQAAELSIQCGKCKTEHKIHAPFSAGIPVPAGAVSFPADNKLKCQQCGSEIDLTHVRRQVEAQVKKTIVS